MSPPYDRYDRGSSRRRGVWGHWVPLVLTVTVATVGLAAWVWSQRNEDEHDDTEPTPDDLYLQQDLDYENADYGDNPAYGASRDVPGVTPPPGAGGQPRSGRADYGAAAPQPDDSAGWGARMSGALRRTPSPQQFLDSAGKTVVAGVAAAGAAVGTALASIREEDKAAYADHETWSEEADSKKDRPANSSKAAGASSRRKTVAIVVSADTHLEDVDLDGFHEHAVSSVTKVQCPSFLTGRIVDPLSYTPTQRLLQDQAVYPDLRPRSQGLGQCHDRYTACIPKLIVLKHWP